MTVWIPGFRSSKLYAVPGAGEKRKDSPYSLSENARNGCGILLPICKVPPPCARAWHKGPACGPDVRCETYAPAAQARLHTTRRKIRIVPVIQQHHATQQSLMSEQKQHPAEAPERRGNQGDISRKKICLLFFPDS